MSQLQATGFVIHRRPYRETSMLVDFFTRQYGKISAVAKGARGANKSDRKSLVQPLQFLSFELRGRSSLKNLGLTEAVSKPLKLHGIALYSAFYLNELLMRAIPDTEPMSLLFEQYQRTLHSLQTLSQGIESQSAQSSKSESITSEVTIAMVEPILREFELCLLQELGYLPDFAYTGDTNASIEKTLNYQFLPEHGFVALLDEQNNLDEQKNLGEQKKSGEQKNALSGNDIIDIANKHFTPSSLRAAKFICRQALLPIIGDKALKSRELFLSR